MAAKLPLPRLSSRLTSLWRRWRSRGRAGHRRSGRPPRRLWGSCPRGSSTLGPKSPLPSVGRTLTLSTRPWFAVSSGGRTPARQWSRYRPLRDRQVLSRDVRHWRRVPRPVESTDTLAGRRSRSPGQACRRRSGPDRDRGGVRKPGWVVDLAWKVPSPMLSEHGHGVADRFAIARSGLPSPFRSPIATERAGSGSVVDLGLRRCRRPCSRARRRWSRRCSRWPGRACRRRSGRRPRPTMGPPAA